MKPSKNGTKPSKKGTEPSKKGVKQSKKGTESSKSETNTRKQTTRDWLKLQSDAAIETMVNCAATYGDAQHIILRYSKHKNLGDEVVVTIHTSFTAEHTINLLLESMYRLALQKSRDDLFGDIFKRPTVKN